MDGRRAKQRSFPSFAGLLDAHVLLSEIESLTETLAGHAWRNQPPAGGMSLPITSQCWPWCWWVTWKERSAELLWARRGTGHARPVDGAGPLSGGERAGAGCALRRRALSLL